VLSSSTESYDRTGKLFAYRRLPSLREYVLISQQERRVEVSHRDGRRWQLEDYSPGDRFTLSSLGVELAVDDLYIDRLGAIIS
jgi:Uma2 family endonuclease